MSITDIVHSVSNVQGAIGGVENFVRSIASMFGVDVVGIFDNDTFEQLWITARPMKASMSVHQKIMDHPIESGAIVSDFAIILPVEIELPLLLTGQDYQQTYQEIQQYIQNRTLVYVALRVGGSMNIPIDMSTDEGKDLIRALVPHFDIVAMLFQKFTESSSVRTDAGDFRRVIDSPNNNPHV